MVPLLKRWFVLLKCFHLYIYVERRINGRSTLFWVVMQIRSGKKHAILAFSRDRRREVCDWFHSVLSIGTRTFPTGWWNLPMHIYVYWLYIYDNRYEFSYSEIFLVVPHQFLSLNCHISNCVIWTYGDKIFAYSGTCWNFQFSICRLIMQPL